ADEHVQAGCGGGVVAVVGEVGFVDDMADLFQRRVGVQAERLYGGLERAPALVVPERGAAHVERRGARGDGGGVGGEDEFGGGVDEAADQPGARGPVDVDTRPGGPLHVRTPAWRAAAARASTAARAASRWGGGEEARPAVPRRSRRSRPRTPRRAGATPPGAAVASAVTASYSAAAAAVIRPARADLAAGSSGWPSQRVASPPWSVTSSAIHSRCSRVRGSAGRATSPSPS